jgi:methylated-DNA-[protein]-cysteine S-methyltransferase
MISEIFFCNYKTPDGLDDLLMTSDGKVLTGLHFAESRKVPHERHEDTECDLPIFRETRRWLDCYFSGREPDFTPPYRIDGLTPFRKDVTDAMLDIPFGQTTTYGSIAAGIARKHGLAKMSAQAVGGAVGWNPICIIIPCHRVIGANGALVGYGGGIDNKIALLAHEKRFTVMV